PREPRVQTDARIEREHFVSANACRASLALIDGIGVRHEHRQTVVAAGELNQHELALAARRRPRRETRQTNVRLRREREAGQRSSTQKQTAAIDEVLHVQWSWASGDDNTRCAR